MKALVLAQQRKAIAKLRPAFKPDGIVTAANSSGINDGAAAIVVMSEEKAKELGVKPMATWVAGALGGVDPSIMGVGPVASTKKVLAKTGMDINDFDLIEANEAFAAQSCSSTGVIWNSTNDVIECKRWCYRTWTPCWSFRMPYPCYTAS